MRREEQMVRKGGGKEEGINKGTVPFLTDSVEAKLLPGQLRWRRSWGLTFSHQKEDLMQEVTIFSNN